MDTTWPATSLDRDLGTARLPLRVMIVDDHAIVREGLRALLEASGELVVAEAEDVGGAVRAAVEAKPQVIIMDVRLGMQSGVEATRAIRAVMPEARILMLTSFADPVALADSLASGAAGFVLKTIVGDDIVRSVRAVARGEQAFDPNLLLQGGLEHLSDSIRARGNGTPVPVHQGPTPIDQAATDRETGTEPDLQGG